LATNGITHQQMPRFCCLEIYTVR